MLLCTGLAASASLTAEDFLQYGFSMLIAGCIRKLSGDLIFHDLRERCFSAIPRSYFKQAIYFNLTGRLIAKLRRQD